MRQMAGLCRPLLATPRVYMVRNIHWNFSFVVKKKKLLDYGGGGPPQALARDNNNNDFNFIAHLTRRSYPKALCSKTSVWHLEFCYNGWRIEKFD